MTADRIREIQEQTAYPDSKSVQQALFQVWNECEQNKPTRTPVDAERLSEMLYLYVSANTYFKVKDTMSLPTYIKGWIKENYNSIDAEFTSHTSTPQQ
jgi:hypothetical protein